MLTQKGKYAIKALVFLAEKGELVRAQEIADGAHIPKKFLESILIVFQLNSPRFRSY